LRAIDREVPADLDVHLILDNSSTHKTPAIRHRLAAHPRFVLHFTPTSRTSASCPRSGYAAPLAVWRVAASVRARQKRPS
jgi:hypothetical protein